MSQVFLCIATRHDPRLVSLAVLICLLMSWTTLKLTRRGLRHRSTTLAAWITAAGVVAGSGIWATHFVAMLAFDPGLPVGYDVVNTLLSIAVAIGAVTLALVIATFRFPLHLFCSGLCVGLGVAAMHYTGMQAVRAPALFVWNDRLAILSLLAGAVLAGFALTVALEARFAGRKLVGTVLLTAAVSIVHFGGMGALKLVPTAAQSTVESTLPSWWLAFAIAGVTTVLLLSALASMMADSYLTRRTINETRRLRTLVNATFEGLLIHANGIIVDANESLFKLLDYQRNELIGHPISKLAATGRQDWIALLETREETDALVTEFLRRDGQDVPVEILGRSIEYQSKPARVIAVRDISERRSSEERIHRLAYHDVLTDLPNRRLFCEHLQLALARVQRGSSLALLCLDLDRFKVINDTFGHQAGDQLLRAAAARLHDAIRSSDVVSRFGGDEFAIVQEFAMQPENATALCRRLVESLAQPFDIDGHNVIIGVSIGVALANDPAMTPDDLLKNADMALYRAKSEGRGTWRFYEAEMDSLMQARHRLELDLRQALALDQFEVVYQPLVDLRSGRISGFEALLRWHHPQRGTVSPAEFIPLAEEIGMIAQIGRWVLYQACADAAQWPGTLRVAVNLSPAQFRCTYLAEEIARTLAETGLPATRLELEVTESLLLGDEPSVLATLHALRDLGLRIAMDDFGTGYSSLSYLRRFPFDKLKIDQSFVRGLSDSEDCSAIVRAISGLGRSLGMTVNAEGVETQRELDALRQESCDEVQGYLFSRPVPRSEIAGLIARYGRVGDEVLPLELD